MMMESMKEKVRQGLAFWMDPRPDLCIVSEWSMAAEQGRDPYCQQIVTALDEAARKSRDTSY